MSATLKIPKILLDKANELEAELQEKWQYTIRSFTDNTDQEDPEYITLREAFMQRFKEHGFVVDSMAKYNEQSKALDEVIKKLKNNKD